MTTVLFIRHGLTDQTGSVLTGWSSGVHLDERGRRQAEGLAQRLRAVPLAAIVTSPLERCAETAAALLDGRELELQYDERLGEVRYGDWTGRELRQVRRDPLWKLVLSHPSGVQFPNGESLRDTQARAVSAIRDWNARLGDDAVYVACSHGDPIRAIAADALGLHLDLIGRIDIDPCSLTVIRYADGRHSGGPPVVVRMNDAGESLDRLLRRGRRRSRPSYPLARLGVDAAT